jgi:hypothetical protein
MKSVVKLVKSLRVEGQVLNAMFLGYFVLLVAGATLIAKGMNSSDASSVTATKDISTSPQLSN